MIKRSNAETTEAITVVTTDSLKAMGITTIEQAMQSIASNQTTTFTGSAVSTWGSGGASTANLRGLGGSKTLVLLDGQRLANNVVLGNAVDLNGIPFAAIERIEIVREGASATYGTDAVGGVVNFITKKNLTSGELNVGGSHPQQAGGSSSDADIAWGKGDLAADGYNLLLTANFTKTNEMRASQRGFAAVGFNAPGGLYNQNGPIGTAPGSYWTTNSNSAAAGSIFQVNNATCPGNIPSLLLRAYGDCAYLYSGAVDLVPPASEASGLVSFTTKLPANNQLAVQYFYTLSKLTTWGGPQTYSFDMTPQLDPTYFPTVGNSTFVFGNVGGATTPNLTDPITAGWTDPGNNRYQSDRNTEQRLMLTLSGTNTGWDYSASANYSRNYNTLNVDGGYANYALLTPNSALINNKLTPVLSNLINPFGPYSAAGQALINSAYVNGELASGSLSLGGVNAHAQHDLWDLFGAGAATIALGLDAREERISFSPTPLATTLYSATYYPPQVIPGNRKVEALSAELEIPVTKQLEFTVSDRLDRYSDFGSTNNGKFSFRFQPLEILTFRGSASTGFRAPSLVDLYSPQVLGATAGSMVGPGCPAGSGPIFTAANCNAQGLSVSGGNPKLGPEKSDNFDLGFVIEPITNLGITVDYYRIRIKNEIQTIPDTAIYANPTAFSSLYKLNSAGTLTQAPLANTACPNGPSSPTCGYILLNSQNTGGIETSGFDLSATHLLKTSFGTIRTGLEGSLVSNFRLQEYQGAPYITRARQFNSGNQPVIGWRHMLTVDWTYANWGAGINNSYLSSYSDQYTDGSGNVRMVDAYSIWGIYGSWKPVKTVTATLGIRNLLNTNPPFSNQSQNWQAGYNPVFSDPTGRAYYAKLKYEF